MIKQILIKKDTNLYLLKNDISIKDMNDLEKRGFSVYSFLNHEKIQKWELLDELNVEGRILGWQIKFW